MFIISNINFKHLLRDLPIPRDHSYPSRPSLSFDITSIPRDHPYTSKLHVSLGISPLTWNLPFGRNHPIYMDYPYPSKLHLSLDTTPLLRNHPNPLDLPSLGTTSIHFEDPYPSLGSSLSTKRVYLSRLVLSFGITPIP